MSIILFISMVQNGFSTKSVHLDFVLYCDFQLCFMKTVLLIFIWKYCGIFSVLNFNVVSMANFLRADAFEACTLLILLNQLEIFEESTSVVEENVRWKYCTVLVGNTEVRQNGNERSCWIDWCGDFWKTLHVSEPLGLQLTIGIWSQRNVRDN